jgi:proline-specific peptidase
MRHRNLLNYQFIFVALVFAILSASVIAEVLYVDDTNGNDTNPGTKGKPVQTISQAAIIVNNNKEPGPTLIKIQPGVYVEDKPVVFDNKRPYSKQKRLTIEAAVLPDDHEWKPTLMPIVLFTIEGHGNENEKHAPGLMLELNHVTIRGLKLLGDPRPRTCTYPIYRWGKDLEDLLVTQCLFIGDREAMPYNCSICANGHGLVVDHCVFYNCEIPIIFWNAEDGLSKGNAMRYSIVDGADIAAVWVCQTAEDFEFHHNVITRSKYVWMRSPNNHKTYKLHDCIITENTYYSGYGTAKELLGQTGPEAKYSESNIIKKGKVILQKDTIPPSLSSVDMPRDYLNIVAGTLGSDLGAGLFKKEEKAKVKMQKTKHFEEGLIRINNAQLYYKAMGQGEPIIVVHGGPGFDHIHMLPFGELASDYKVVFYDQRATGNSTGSVDSNSITVDNFVEDLEGLRKGLKLGKINVIGHSWGAALAAFYGIKYPRNLKTLILLGAGASSEYLDQYFKNIQNNTTPEDSLTLKHIAQSQAFKEKQVEAVQNYFRIAVKPLFHNQHLAEKLDLTLGKKTVKNQSQVNQLLFEETRNFNIYDELSIIKCPTLIVHGDSDPLPDEAPLKIHQHISQSKFVTLKQAGHFMFIESPDELFSTIRSFLKDNK